MQDVLWHICMLNASLFIMITFYIYCSFKFQVDERSNSFAPVLEDCLSFSTLWRKATQFLFYVMAYFACCNLRFCFKVVCFYFDENTGN